MLIKHLHLIGVLERPAAQVFTLFIRFVLFLLLLVVQHLYSITIGSDTVVNRLGFQVIGNGDRVANFAFLEGGFALQSTSVTATLDTFFPTTGLVDLNGGTLYLNKDFVLHNVVQLQTGGNIIGNGKMLDLAQTVTCVPLGIGGCTAVLNTTQATPSAINSVSWSFDSRFIAVATNTTGGAELVIYEFDGSSLTLRASLNRTVSFRCVAWHPSLYLLALGTASDGANAELVMFSFNPNTFSLTITDSEEFSANVSAVSWHPQGEYLAVGSSATTREIALYPVSSGGIFGTPVNVNITPNDVVNINALSWNYDGTLLASGHAANLRVYVFTNTPSLTLNTTLAVAGGVNGVAWNPNFTFRDILAIGTVSNVPRLRVYRHIVSPASLTQLLTSALDATVRGTQWSPDGYCLGVTKNTSLGANEFFIYAFNTDPLTLVNVTSFNSASSLSALAWTPNGRYVATGAVNNLLSIYATTGQLLANGMFNWSDLYVRLNTDTCINNCTLRFQGNCTLDGRGNTFSLSPTSTILIDSNATLLIRDMLIRGVTDRNISCVDSTSTCTFENVEMILDGNYTFDQGRFDVLESLLVRGAGKIFVLRTGQVNTILKNSIAELDNQVTFSYDPSPVRRDGFSFEDQSSHLVLNGATLHATSTGISFEKGTLIVKTTAVLEGEGTLSGGAITFGNGISANCNQTIEFYPDAQISIGSGAVIYNNI